jgi:hypothetical protein
MKMRFNYHTLILIPALLFAACATPSKDVTTSTNDMVCEKQAPIGSAIPVTRCRTKADIETARRAAEQAQQAIPSRANPPGKAGS